ncbi:MAG: hypothetical protein R3D33_11185 [Hyphomicrobiaceae bacterium]
MHDKQFMREMLADGARALKDGRMDRRTFLVLCGMAGSRARRCWLAMQRRPPTRS